MALTSGCQYRGCFKPSTVEHTVGPRMARLCVRHRDAIRAALRQPDRFEVRWGESTADLRERFRRRLDQLKTAYREDEPPDDWDPFALNRPPSENERIGSEISELEERLRNLDDEPEHPALLSIRELVRWTSG